MDQVPAWIQASAPIVQALATVILVLVTAKYVLLTHNLSKTANHQLALLRDTEFHRRRADLIHVTFFTRRILKSLDELPANKGDHNASGRLLRASLWRSEEVGELGLLVAKAGPDFARKAEQPAVDLNWLLERINLVRTEQRGQGFEMASFAWDDYAVRMTRTKAALSEIADDAASHANSLTATTAK
jgi:hypothetical protein